MATERVHRRHPVGRHVHELVRRRRTAGVAGLIAVLGPGVLAGLSDDDPPGITTYSVLGADYGYRLLWVVTISTIALITYHEVAARTGIVTGKGLMRLMRERYGARTVRAVLVALVVANIGTLCGEFAGIAGGAQLVFGVSRYLSVPIAAAVVSVLVVKGSFHRVEHILLALSAVFVAYIAAGLLAGPDWHATARGLVVPAIPGGTKAILAIVAAVGTTLAPWGLVFIQSYAVDKQLRPKDLRFERIDVAAGAVMTGVIGVFVVIACAATLHAHGVKIHDVGDAAGALEPLAGSATAELFGVGFLGAALLAVAIVPLSTAYSVGEALGRPADLDLKFEDARAFYLAFGAALVFAAGIVLVPGVSLVPVLFLSQALNAALLLAILPFIRAIARDESLMGEHRLGRTSSIATALSTALIAASVAALAYLAISP
jgi:Mn2+/Fe2+ NRAMP family transporter